LRSIWRRCKEAAQGDAEIEDAELRKICHRLLWKHANLRRCLHWAAEHTDLRLNDNRPELWRICHRMLWNQKHPT
jgi:hypothetical protein